MVFSLLALNVKIISQTAYFDNPLPPLSRKKYRLFCANKTNNNLLRVITTYPSHYFHPLLILLFIYAIIANA